MSDLLIHRHGRVLQLTLNRPQARNALNNALLTQIAEALEAAAVDDSVGVCVIRGNARFFAAGADLNEMAEKDLPATLDDIRPRLWGRIDAFTKPLIASVNGYALGAGVKNPERVAGLHFFNPAPVMKLVEVVSGLATSTEVVEQLCQCVSGWGKQPVRCRSTPGFIVNRVARPFYAEAWRALEEQVAAPEVIDAALRDGGGFPMGPLALTDLIGQDVNFAVTCSVFNAFWQDRRYLPSLLQQELALAGRLGKKSGHGVYRWPAETLPDAALPPVMMGAESVTVRSDNVTELDDVLLLETEGETALALSVKHHRPVVVYDLCASDTVVLAAAATNAPAATDKAVHYFQQQGKKVLRIADYPGLLVWRTVAMLINEALDAVQKGVASPQDVDTAMRLGVNYPHGPLAWGERLGWRRVLQLLENLQHHYGEERYRPCSLLRQKTLMEKHHEQ